MFSNMHIRTSVLAVGTGLTLAVGAGVMAPAASAAPACGYTVTGSMSGPSGSRWEHVTVRNCNSVTVKRRVTVSNFVDDVCETYAPGQIRYLQVMTAPFGSHADGLKSC